MTPELPPFNDIASTFSGFWKQAKTPRSGFAACAATVMASGIVVLGTRIYEREKTIQLYKHEEENTRRCFKHEEEKTARFREKTIQLYRREEENTRRCFKREEEKTEREKRWRDIYATSVANIVNAD